jgi:hypothetical protein
MLTWVKHPNNAPLRAPPNLAAEVSRIAGTGAFAIRALAHRLSTVGGAGATDRTMRGGRK